jgi:cellulose synthase/poly-beta-1,6-N-acetylglucosamine synthase-like glycosyltransferase
VIPAHNAARTVGACVEALLVQTIATSRYEVIVVDDGSTDDTAAVAARAGARVIGVSRAGPAGARNHGVRSSTGEIVLFTDADCVPAPDWIERMIGPFAAGADGVKGAYLTRQRSLVARFVQAEFEERYDRLARFERIDFVDTYSAGYRRDVLVESGGFDSRFALPSAEDVDLSFRLAQKGYRFVFEPRARVYHQHPATLRAYLTRKWRYGVYRAVVYRRYPGKVTGDSYTPRLMLAEITLAGLTLASVFGAAVDRRFLRLAGPFALGHVVASVPFAARYASADVTLALASPVLLFLRSYAQLSGLITGFVRSAVTGSPKTPR